MAKYIDADAVIEELRQIYHSCDDWEEHISQSGATESEKRILINRASATKMVMIEVRLRVDKIPSADVVERKKGKWIKYDNGTYYCNLCHSWIPNEQRHYACYCLFCGAEMEEQDG